jgi:hypothetical protein
MEAIYYSENNNNIFSVNVDDTGMSLGYTNKDNEITYFHLSEGTIITIFVNNNYEFIGYV